jgi:hypothetical protein
MRNLKPQYGTRENYAALALDLASIAAPGADLEVGQEAGGASWIVQSERGVVASLHMLTRAGKLARNPCYSCTWDAWRAIVYIDGIPRIGTGSGARQAAERCLQSMTEAP